MKFEVLEEMRGQIRGYRKGFCSSKGKSWRCGWQELTGGEGLWARRSRGAPRRSGRGSFPGSAQVRQAAEREVEQAAALGLGERREGGRGALPGVPPSKLRHRQFPAREVPDLQSFASKLLEIPAVS